MVLLIQIIYDARLYQHIQYLVNYQDICRISVGVCFKELKLYVIIPHRKKISFLCED